jgi:hypothetical protein
MLIHLRDSAMFKSMLPPPLEGCTAIETWFFMAGRPMPLDCQHASELLGRWRAREWIGLHTRGLFRRCVPWNSPPGHE